MVYKESLAYYNVLKDEKADLKLWIAFIVDPYQLPVVSSSNYLHSDCPLSSLLFPLVMARWRGRRSLSVTSWHKAVCDSIVYQSTRRSKPSRRRAVFAVLVYSFPGTKKAKQGFQRERFHQSLTYALLLPSRNLLLRIFQWNPSWAVMLLLKHWSKYVSSALEWQIARDNVVGDNRNRTLFRLHWHAYSWISYHWFLCCCGAGLKSETETVQLRIINIQQQWTNAPHLLTLCPTQTQQSLVARRQND